MSNSTSTQQPAQSSIPRFVPVSTEAVQFGLSSNSSASAPCFVPTALAGSGHAHVTKDNSKQFKLGMNCSNGICDISNNSGCHNGNIDKYATKKSHLPGNYFNSANRNRNTSLSYSSKTLSLAGNKSQTDQIVTSKERVNQELNYCIDSSHMSHLPSSLSTLSITKCESASKSGLNALSRTRTNSLPSSNSNLSESPSLHLPVHQDVDIALNHSNLPVYSTVDSNCVQNHIAAKCTSLSAQPNSKMTQPTKMSTHQLRLIKSQSLKFDSHYNNSSYSAHLSSQKAKGEASKSLDTVDNLDLYSSKLPRSLTLSNKAISPKMASNLNDCELLFSDLPTDQTPGSLSRSSTASLGVLSNLNDVLAAAIPGDCSDDDIDEIGARLSAIDESLSPLPSLDSMAFLQKDAVQANESTLFDKVEIENIINLDHEDDVMFHKTGAISDIQNDNTNVAEQDIISLNSIDVTEHSEANYIGIEELKSKPKNSITQISSKQINKGKEVESINSKSDNRTLDKNPKKITLKSSVTPRPSTLSKFSIPKAPNRIASTFVNSRNDTSNLRLTKAAANKRVEFNVMNRKQSSTKSSLPSSSNASRTSTPALSESEMGELNSLCSNSSAMSFSNALSSKLSNHPSLTNQRLTQRVLGNTSNHKQMPEKFKHIKTIPSKQNAHGAAISTITRSSTYTRSLNTAPNANNATSKKVEASSAPKNEPKTKFNLKPDSQANEPRKAFAKPTTSYLKKTTTKSVVAQSTLPKRPSSVASNSSTTSHSVPTSARNKSLAAQNTSISRSPVVTAKRSPTITLLSSAANSKSGQSSRRSSITSPSKSSGPVFKKDDSAKPNTDISQQLRHYQALCLQKANQLTTLEAGLKHSSLLSGALLALNAHLINEYAPFDTPKLRAELASLHQKCFLLHRDCELSKESAFQKDNTIAILNSRLSEALTEVASHKNEICSFNAKLNEVEQELLSVNEERARLEETLYETQQELCSEKDARLNVETRLEQLELSCRSDKKYRDLKEKVSTYEKEVDSLNVVVDMKTQRTRHLEGEIMRIELELSNYENLKESYQRLQRENEALTETLGMKARKNAEQSREIEHLRGELKREANERKRTSIRNDQLEYQLNETREMLSEVSFASDFAPTNENNLDDCDQKDDTASQARFNSFLGSVNQSSKHTLSSNQRPSGRNYVRRLFSTPSISHESHLQSRQHYQHQDPATNSKHRLPELVLSSIGANWSLGRFPHETTSSASSSESNFHSNDPVHNQHNHSDSQSSNCSNNSSPLASPNIVISKKSDSFNDFPTNVSTPST